jgi:hypothetical protein
VERIVQTDEIGSDDVTDLFQFSTSQNFEKHRFNLDLNIDRTEREQLGPDTINTILNGQHFYRPDDTLSVETFANITDLQQEEAVLDTRFTRSDINSFAIWRSQDRPLTVDANARFVANRNEAAGAVSETFTESLRVGARYDLSEKLRLSGNVTGVLNQSDDDSMSTSQDVTATYQSGNIPLRNLSYNWSTSGTVANRTDTDQEAVQRLSWNAGHGISRVVALANNAAVTLSLNQNVGAFNDSDIGSEQNLNHNGTLTFNRSTGRGTTNVTLNVTDSRRFGIETDSGSENTSFQAATLQASHFQTLSQYSSWDAGLNFQVNRFADGTSETFESSNANFSYQHARAFGVRRLRFRSEFEARTNSLNLASEDDDDQRELSWENELDYSIGRLELNLKSFVVDRDGEQDITVFLSVRRFFDGRVFDN